MNDGGWVLSLWFVVFSVKRGMLSRSPNGQVVLLIMKQTECEVMSDPFKLFGRLILAGFKITGYMITGAAETAWYVAHGRRDLVGQVIGDLGRGITNAISHVFSE